MDARRVVLVKPGDVLMVGNLGEMTDEAAKALSDALGPLKKALGVEQIFCFEADIDLAVTDGKGA
jgi:hypothetical protein